MNPDNRYVPPGAPRGANADRAAYLHAERMLDRYGVAYVCRHPELLLGESPLPLVWRTALTRAVE